MYCWALKAEGYGVFIAALLPDTSVIIDFIHKTCFLLVYTIWHAVVMF